MYIHGSLCSVLHLFGFCVSVICDGLFICFSVIFGVCSVADTLALVKLHELDCGGDLFPCDSGVGSQLFSKLRQTGAEVSMCAIMVHCVDDCIIQYVI